MAESRDWMICPNHKYDPPAVRFIEEREEDGFVSSRTPEPPLDKDWTDLAKLRWQAALIEYETGIDLRVAASDFYVDDVRQEGYYGISMHLRTPDGTPVSTVHAGLPYGECWVYLNGIRTGAEAVLHPYDGILNATAP